MAYVVRRYRTWWLYISRGYKGKPIRQSFGHNEQAARMAAADVNEAAAESASVGQLADRLVILSEEIRGRSRTLRSLADEWLAAKALTLKPATISWYRTYVDLFLGHCGSRPYKALTAGPIVTWVAAQTTPQSHIRTLKALGTYCHRHGLWRDNPLMTLEGRGPIARTRRLSDEEVDAVLEKVAGTEIEGVVLAGLDAGLRVSEVCNARLEHVNRKERTLRVIGKRDKVRVVGLTRRLLRAIPEGTQGRCFMRLDGQPWTRYALYWHISQQLGVGPHDLRRTCASRMLERGASAAEVRDALGHGSVATTNLYLKTMPAALLKAFDRLEQPSKRPRRKAPVRGRSSR